MTDSITMEHLYKSFSGKPVLEDFSLFLRPGEPVCLFGPSGCGKTTLLRILAGLEKRDSGSISGTEGLAQSFVFQENRLFPWLNARQNVEIVGDKAHSCLGKGEKLLTELGLGDALEQFPHQLSGGMQRRVAIARALYVDAPLLLLDEALKGLDREARLTALSLIRQQLPGRYLLFVTHDPEEASLLGADGKGLILSGPPLAVLGEIPLTGNPDIDRPLLLEKRF